MCSEGIANTRVASQDTDTESRSLKQRDQCKRMISITTSLMDWERKKGPLTRLLPHQVVPSSISTLTGEPEEEPLAKKQAETELTPDSGVAERLSKKTN